MLMILFPARPSRLNAMSMPSARRNVCARRRRPASARGFLGQPVLSLGIPLLRPALTRKRSAALPLYKMRSAMISRTHAATGSASIMPRSLPRDWRIGSNECARGPERRFTGGRPLRKIGHPRQAIEVNAIDGPQPLHRRVQQGAQDARPSKFDVAPKLALGPSALLFDGR
jgi:hypothetical protein